MQERKTEEEQNSKKERNLLRHLGVVLFTPYKKVK